MGLGAWERAWRDARVSTTAVWKRPSRPRGVRATSPVDRRGQAARERDAPLPQPKPRLRTFPLSSRPHRQSSAECVESVLALTRAPRRLVLRPTSAPQGHRSSWSSCRYSTRTLCLRMQGRSQERCLRWPGPRSFPHVVGVGSEVADEATAGRARGTTRAALCGCRRAGSRNGSIRRRVGCATAALRPTRQRLTTLSTRTPSRPSSRSRSSSL